MSPRERPQAQKGTASSTEMCCLFSFPVTRHRTVACLVSRCVPHVARAMDAFLIRTLATAVLLTSHLDAPVISTYLRWLSMDLFSIGLVQLYEPIDGQVIHTRTRDSYPSPVLTLDASMPRRSLSKPQSTNEKKS